MGQGYVWRNATAGVGVGPFVSELRTGQAQSVTRGMMSKNSFAQQTRALIEAAHFGSNSFFLTGLFNPNSFEFHSCLQNLYVKYFCTKLMGVQIGFHFDFP